MTPLHDARQELLFPKMSDEKLDELPQYGDLLDLPEGEVLFREGDQDYPFHAILSGRIRITKRFGSMEQVLTVHERGAFAGDLTMITGMPAEATATVWGGPARVVRIEIRKFRAWVVTDDPLAKSTIRAIAGRARDVEVQARQQEKLAALGKLSAGLAHELNNPAAAARRAVELLVRSVEEQLRSALPHDRRLTPEQSQALLRVANLKRCGLIVDPLTHADREQELTDWLEQQGVASAWEMASTLNNCGIFVDDLHQLASSVSGEPLQFALERLSGTLLQMQLAKELESSVTRISELVGAMKEYTYLDRASFQDTDVHLGLENTLKVFTPRLKKGVDVVRRYDPHLPKICAHPGELNQVWTNLIDNAIYAMDGRGTLTVATRPYEDGIEVEIGDTGSGIPPEVQSRIFEPFFTTKKLGEGTGLGLDITHRLVTVRHGGSIRVASAPGDTRFYVYLPSLPPKQPE